MLPRRKDLICMLWLLGLCVPCRGAELLLDLKTPTDTPWRVSEGAEPFLTVVDGKVELVKVDEHASQVMIIKDDPGIIFPRYEGVTAYLRERITAFGDTPPGTPLMFILTDEEAYMAFLLIYPDRVQVHRQGEIEPELTVPLGCTGEECLNTWRFWRIAFRNRHLEVFLDCDHLPLVSMPIDYQYVGDQPHANYLSFGIPSSYPSLGNGATTVEVDYLRVWSDISLVSYEADDVPQTLPWHPGDGPSDAVSVSEDILTMTKAQQGAPPVMYSIYPRGVSFESDTGVTATLCQMFEQYGDSPLGTPFSFILTDEEGYMVYLLIYPSHIAQHRQGMSTPDSTADIATGGAVGVWHDWKITFRRRQLHVYLDGEASPLLSTEITGRYLGSDGQPHRNLLTFGIPSSYPSMGDGAATVHLDFLRVWSGVEEFEIPQVTTRAGVPFEIPIFAMLGDDALGYSICLTYPEEYMTISDVSLAGTDAHDAAMGLEYQAEGGVLSVVVPYSYSCHQGCLSVGKRHLATIVAEVNQAACEIGPESLAIRFTEEEPAHNRLSFCDSSTVRPNCRDGSVTLDCTPWFVRGDCNTDGQIDIGDPIRLLGYLFAGATTPSCLDACDLSDNESLDIGDAIYALQYLIGRGSPPMPPFPLCGPDPTPVEPLGCASFPPCP